MIKEKERFLTVERLERGERISVGQSEKDKKNDRDRLEGKTQLKEQKPDSSFRWRPVNLRRASRSFPPAV